MKKFGICSIFALTMILFCQCIRPPNYDGIVNIQTNEIAFSVDLRSDDSATASKPAVQAKDIPIPGYWVKTGRFDHVGYWRPSIKVIVVSQAPIRLDWDKSVATKTVRMTSQESSGFIVPMSINAYIDNSADAQKYLRSFKPVVNEAIDWSKLAQKEWGPYVKESAQPLEDALNSVVFTQFLDQLSQLFVKTPILNAEVSSKIYIPAVTYGMKASELATKIKEATGVNISFEYDVQSIKDWAKNTYGITITAVAPGDGIVYDNSDVQKQIDALAAGVMKEKTLAQDRQNAEAAQKVKIIEADTERRVQEAKSSSSVIAAARAYQEIENTKTIAEATAKAIESGKVVPQGSYPLGLNSLVITPNYNSFGR